MNKKTEKADKKIAIKRYEMYETNIEPVIKFYKQSKLLKVVNGEKPINEISDEISDLIEGFKGWLWEIRQYKYAGKELLIKIWLVSQG